MYHQVVSGLVATVVIVAANTGDAACQASAGGVPCWADTHGIYVSQARVYDKVTFRCDPPPLAFRGVVIVQRKAATGWAGKPSRPPVDDLPDAAGYQDLYGGVPCRPGDWRTAWRVSGVDAAGHSFKGDWDHDFGSTMLTEADCLQRTT